MFSMRGVLHDGTVANLVWHEGRGFGGDQVALQAIDEVIAAGELVASTVEGPFWQPGAGPFEVALPTASAGFARVLAFHSDEPVPSYDGGVVHHGSDLEDPQAGRAFVDSREQWVE